MSNSNFTWVVAEGIENTHIALLKPSAVGLCLCWWQMVGFRRLMQWSTLESMEFQLKEDNYLDLITILRNIDDARGE